MSYSATFTMEQQTIVDCARDWGYFRGSIKNRKDLWKNKRILDIGMGAGPHSLAFINGGCKSYVGVDPLLGSEHVRDYRSSVDKSIPNYHAFPHSPDTIMSQFPNVHLYPAYLEDVTEEVKNHDVDFALLAAVTEHLQNVPAVFQSIWEILGAGGLLWFCHCNYYSWTGHHRLPRSVEQLDPTDDRHAQVIDWKHLEPTHRDYSNANFNRVRLSDLRDITHKYFEIIEWSVGIHGRERLTPEIREKYKKYSLEELLGQNIYVTARRRDEPLPIDLADREFFHPSEDYRATDDYSGENIEDYGLTNFVFLSEGNQINSHSTNDNAGARFFETLEPGDRVILKKFTHEMALTVKQIITPEGQLSRIKVQEDIPPIWIETTYDQWQLKRA